MIQTITLNILAEDIKASSFRDGDFCPITKALDKAGYPNWKASGTFIAMADNADVKMNLVDPTALYGLNTMVIGMMMNNLSEAERQNVLGSPLPIDIEDFRFDLMVHVEDPPTEETTTE